MRLNRMYTEPSCTPTRCAFMTGRQPHRYGDGRHRGRHRRLRPSREEKSPSPKCSPNPGYSTTHIGKWHMGDIKESWPNHQGFDFAAFPIHQQGQLTVFNDDAAKEGVAVSIGPGQYDPRFTKDNWFRPNPAAMVVGCEGSKGERHPRSPHEARRTLDREEIRGDEPALPGPDLGAPTQAREGRTSRSSSSTGRSFRSRIPAPPPRLTPPRTAGPTSRR